MAKIKSGKELTKRRVTIRVHESELSAAELAKIDAEDPHREYTLAANVAAEKVSGHGGIVTFVKAHHRWVGPKGIEREWRFVYDLIS